MANETTQPASAPSSESLITARFRDSDQLQEAARQLATAGFDRADMRLADSHSGATPETEARPVNSEQDARQARTLGTSTGAAVAAMAAAGVTIATGGAAAPAVVAAVAAGGLTGGGIFAASSAAASGEQNTRDQDAAMGNLMLNVRAATPERHQKAVEILQAAGAELLPG